MYYSAMKKLNKILLIISVILVAVGLGVLFTTCNAKSKVSVETTSEEVVSIEQEKTVENPEQEQETTPETITETKTIKEKVPEDIVGEIMKTPEPEPAPIPEINVEKPEENIPETVEEPEPEPEPEPVKEPEPEPEVQVDEEEYTRSTKTLAEGESITKNEFAEDKTEILQIIKELQEIMNNKDYESWLTYIAPDSIKFYSTPKKIRKGRQYKIINGLEDYFLDIFIPARKQSSVKEIRYISKTSIKAVDVISNKIRTYYNFVKIDGKWYVELPDITVK